MSGRQPEERIRWPAVHQSWRRVTFLHWPVATDDVARLLPADLEPDLIGGRAWVSITPFEVRNFRVLGVPPMLARSNFPETNVRTYVRHRDGGDGLWFLSLDVSSNLNVAAGRLIGAPYHRSTMAVEGEDRITYRGQRAEDGARYELSVDPGGPLEPDAVVEQLTGRWRAYTCVAGQTLQVPVAHEPWPLRRAELVSIEETLLAAPRHTAGEEQLKHLRPARSGRGPLDIPMGNVPTGGWWGGGDCTHFGQAVAFFGRFSRAADALRGRGVWDGVADRGTRIAPALRDRAPRSRAPSSRTA